MPHSMPPSAAKWPKRANTLQVKHRYADYLDKPPLLFWLSSLSIWAFGAEPWAYKLPSFLFTVLGLWSVYRFALIYYPQKVAWFATFILSLVPGVVSVQQRCAYGYALAVPSFLPFGSRRATWNTKTLGLGAGWRGYSRGHVGQGAHRHRGAGVGHRHTPVGRPPLENLFPSRLAAVAGRGGRIAAAHVLRPVQTVRACKAEFFFWKQSFGRITGENEWRNRRAGYFYFPAYVSVAFCLGRCLAIPAFYTGAVCFGRAIRFRCRKSQPRGDVAVRVLLPFIAFVVLTL